MAFLRLIFGQSHLCIFQKYPTMIGEEVWGQAYPRQLSEGVYQKTEVQRRVAAQFAPRPFIGAVGDGAGNCAAIASRQIRILLQ